MCQGLMNIPGRSFSLVGIGNIFKYSANEWVLEVKQLSEPAIFLGEFTFLGSPKSSRNGPP